MDFSRSKKWERDGKFLAVTCGNPKGKKETEERLYPCVILYCMDVTYSSYQTPREMLCKTFENRPVSAVSWCELQDDKLLLAIGLGKAPQHEKGDMQGRIEMFVIDPEGLDEPVTETLKGLPACQADLSEPVSSLAFSHEARVKQLKVNADDHEHWLSVGTGNGDTYLYAFTYGDPSKAPGSRASSASGGWFGLSKTQSPQPVENKMAAKESKLIVLNQKFSVLHEEAEVLTTCFSHNSHLLVYGGKFNTVQLIDTRMSVKKRGLEPKRTIKGEPIVFEYSAFVYSVAFAPDDKRLACGGYDNNVKVFDVRTGNAILRLQHSNAVRDISFSPDGKLIASGGRDKQITIFNSKSGRAVRKITSDTKDETEVRAIRFSPNGHLLVSAGTETKDIGGGVRGGGKVRVDLIMKTPEALVKLDANGHDEPERTASLPVHEHGVSISPDGKYVVVLLGDNDEKKEFKQQLQIWCLSGKEQSTAIANKELKAIYYSYERGESGDSDARHRYGAIKGPVNGVRFMPRHLRESRWTFLSERQAQKKDNKFKLRCPSLADALMQRLLHQGGDVVILDIDDASDTLLKKDLNTLMEDTSGALTKDHFIELKSTGPDGTPVVKYMSPDRDYKLSSNEMILFVSTNSGLFAYELDRSKGELKLEDGGIGEASPVLGPKYGDKKGLIESFDFLPPIKYASDEPLIGIWGGPGGMTQLHRLSQTSESAMPTSQITIADTTLPAIEPSIAIQEKQGKQKDPPALRDAERLRRVYLGVHGGGTDSPKIHVAFSIPKQGVYWGRYEIKKDPKPICMQALSKCEEWTKCDCLSKTLQSVETCTNTDIDGDGTIAGEAKFKWQWIRGREKGQQSGEESDRGKLRIECSVDRSCAAGFSPTGQYFAVSSEDGVLHLYCALTGDELRQHTEHYIARSVGFLEGDTDFDPPFLYSAGRNSCITLRDAASGVLMSETRSPSWITALDFHPSSGLLAVGTVKEGTQLQYAMLNPLCEKAVAFWSGKEAEPPVDGLLNKEMLLYQTSPSGRSLITHKAVLGMGAWLHQATLQMPDDVGPALLRRDIDGWHALDHALHRTHYDALKYMLKAVVRLPPCAREALVNEVPDPAGQDSAAPTGGWFARVLSCGQREERKGGRHPAPSFLPQLARSYPALCAKLLRDVGLDDYEEYEGHPQDTRVPKQVLTAVIKERKYALKANVGPTPAFKELWHEDICTMQPKWYHWLPCCRIRQQSRGKVHTVDHVDVECRMAGIPGMMAGPERGGKELKYGRLFTTLVDVYGKSERHVFRAMSSDVVLAAVEFKWQQFGEKAWWSQVRNFAFVTFLLFYGSIELVLNGPRQDAEFTGHEYYTAALGCGAIGVALLAQLFALAQKNMLIHNWSNLNELVSIIIEWLLLGVLGFVFLIYAGKLIQVTFAPVDLESFESAHGFEATSGLASAGRMLRGGGSSGGGAPLSGPNQELPVRVFVGDEEVFDSTDVADVSHSQRPWWRLYTRYMACAGSILVFFKFYFLSRGIEQITGLVIVLHQIIIDMIPFFAVAFAFMLAVGMALAVITTDSNYDLSSMRTLMLEIYLALLGDFGEVRDAGLDDLLSWFLFIMFSFGSNLVLLNALIAMMGDTYSRMRDYEDEHRALQKAQLVSEIQKTLRKDQLLDKELFPNWVHVLRQKYHVGLTAEEEDPDGDGLRGVPQGDHDDDIKARLQNIEQKLEVLVLGQGKETSDMQASIEETITRLLPPGRHGSASNRT